MSSFLAGMSSGRLVDRAKKFKNVGFAFSVIVVAGMSLTLFAFWVKELWIAFVIGILLGFAETSISTLLSSIVSKDFGGQLEAFAAKIIVNSIGIISGFILQIVMSSHSPYYILILSIVGKCFAGISLLFYK